MLSLPTFQLSLASVYHLCEEDLKIFHVALLDYEPYDGEDSRAFLSIGFVNKTFCLDLFWFNVFGPE